MRKAFTKFIFLTLVTVLLAGLALGQATMTYGRLEGTVKDQTGAIIPGVSVTLKSDTGTKTTLTGDRGFFAFPFLTPRTYEIRVELEGFKVYSQTGIDIRLGLTTNLNIVLETGEITDVIEVTGEAPLVDTSTTTIGANISDSLFINLPVRRNFTALFSFAPGVADGLGAGAANPSIGGASALENQYIIDGVNITNTGYGSVGTYSNVYGSLGTGVNFDFIKEVQVKAGGFEAEYGQAQGGVINVITKSGSNEFHGGVYFYGSPAGFQYGRKQPNIYRDNKGTEVMSNENWDVSADVSGYLWQDRFFFYAGFNPQWLTSIRRAPAGFGQDIDGLDVYDREDNIYSWSAKLTWVPHDNHNFEFSSTADPSKRGLGPNRSMMTESDSAYSRLTYGSWNWIGRYNGVITNNWFLTASLGRAYNRFQETHLYGNIYQYRDYIEYFYNHYLPANPGAEPGNYGRLLLGGPGFYENNNGENYQFNIKSTFNFEAGGDHQFDFGYTYEDVTYTAQRRYTGPMVTIPAYSDLPSSVQTYGAYVYRQWLTDDGVNSVNGYLDINQDGIINTADSVYRQIRGNYNDPDVATTTSYHSFYLQDAWKMTDRITFKLGLRYDYQKIAGGGDAATDFVFDGNWAPRLGLIFDVFGDGKTKAYGSWGRFYQKIPNDLAVRSLSVETGITNAFWGDAGLTDFINQDLVDLGYSAAAGLGLTGSHPTLVVPEAKASYQDEFVVGFDHEINPTLSIGGRFIWRDLKRILEDVSGNTSEMFYQPPYNFVYVILNPEYNIDYFDNATGAMEPDGVPDGFADPARSYSAFELTLEKRFSEGFQFMANWRWAKLWGVYEGLLRNDNGQDDPHITSLYDFRDSPAVAYQFVPGYLNTDTRHIVNFNGTYTFDWDMTLGLGARFASGQPITPLGSHPAYGNDGEVPLRPRGADGRSPWINTIDVSVGYPVKFGDNYRLRFSVDLFNVFNRQQATRIDEDAQYGGSPSVEDVLAGYPAVDYGTALRFQRSFNMRFAIRFEF